MQVFGCIPVYPERNLSGEWIVAGTGVPDVKISGIHLQLPGYGDDGPTIEIFQYNLFHSTFKQHINRQGFAHIAFSVNDVDEMLARVIEHGGGQLGDVVQQDIQCVGFLTFVYASDPEGNFIELQNYEIIQQQKEIK